jgi:hypothetical protein
MEKYFKTRFLGLILGIVLLFGVFGAVIVSQQRQEIRSKAAGTSVNLVVFLHGIGKGGDSANPTAVGTPNPARAQRTVAVEIYNAQNQLMLTKQATVTFNSTSGNFTGSFDRGVGIPTGPYFVKLKTDQYLRATVPGIQQIAFGQDFALPPTTLIAGDINNDNAINILDYSILIGCYSDFSPAPNCTPANKLLADLTDDGAVNQFDYNFFLRETSNRQGDSGGGTVMPTKTPTLTPTKTPTLTPTRTPTPKPPVSGGKNCVNQPSACGFPDKTNTGVVPGTQLTRVDGAVTLSTPGMVYSNKEVHGNIIVKANNVTIRNVKIVGGSYYAISIQPWDNPVTGTLIENVEIDFQGYDNGKGIAFSNYTARKVYFHNGADCFHFSSNVTIEDSYCTVYPDNASAAQIQAFCNKESHIDGMQNDGGNGIMIRHNTILNPCNETSAILISSNTSTIQNVTITNNLLGGGGWTLYCSAAGNDVRNETVTNNRFSRLYYPKGGYWGPAAGCELADVFTGNIWDDTLSPL